MLLTNRVFLQLLTCVLLTFACTSSKKKPTAPTPANNQQGTDQSDVNELKGELNALVSKITALQARVGQGDVSQTDLGDWKKNLTEALAKIDALENNTGNDRDSKHARDIVSLKEELNNIEEQVEELRKNLPSAEASKEETEEEEEISDDTTDADTEEKKEKDKEGGTVQDTDAEPSPTDAELKVEVSLAEIQDNGNGESGSEKEAGTYVTFHSNKTVTIQKITYGDLDFKQETLENATTSLLSMTLLIAMKFTHSGKTHCVAAKLDLLDLLANSTEKVEMTTKALDASGVCKP